MPLSARNARKALGAAAGEVVLGARHGTIRLHADAVAGAIAGRIYTIEPTGDITFAHVRIGRAIIVASLEPHVRFSPDAPVWVAFDQDRLHLFDASSGNALRLPG